jgi:hypothetical protein
MNFEEIAEKAYKGLEIDKNSNLPTKYAYLQLKDLYLKYKYGDLSKEKCITLKNQIRQQYNADVLEDNRNIEIYKEYTKNKIENTTLLINVEKSRDKKEIVSFLSKIVANCIKDDSFVERVLAKWNEIDF